MTDNEHHPLFAALMTHAGNLFTQVEAGELDAHVAMACLTADALAASVEESTPPDVADALLEAATTWATRRYRALLAEVVLHKTPIPDDVSDIDDDGVES